ncbi:MAG: GNAT family protein [Chloroflexi bacterium]|nr:GNAT family protein [Chloroflexota bacterium]
MSTNPQSESPEATSPIYNIVGDKVALGPLRKDLVPLYTRWFNDFTTLRMLGPMPRPLTLEQEEQWYERANTRGDAVVQFTIYEKNSGRPIGTTGLHDIDYRNRTALFGITIGEPDARGKGYGTEATQLMLDFAFTVQGLHNVILHVHEYNLAGIRAYTKAGFTEFGRRRESHFMGGKYWDLIHMECLATEWGPSPVLAEVFKPDAPR